MDVMLYNAPYLASPIVTQQSEDLVLIHLEAQVVDRYLRAEGLLESVDDYSGWSSQLLVHGFLWDALLAFLQIVCSISSR